MQTLKIALDWTPNINHVGIFVARALGYYRANMLDVEILNPLDDNYALTPGKKLELGLADFSIAPFETVISLNNKKASVDAVAVYAILQEDISSIASLKRAGFKSPKDLDAKTYASYKARYEDAIVKKMIINDGGTGNLDINYPNKLGIWNTLLQGEADATWIFDNWEGIEAETKNIALNKFTMRDYGVPYCYSPVILTKKSNIEKNIKNYKAFIEATKKGYAFSVENQDQSIDILKEYLTDYDKEQIDLLEAMRYTVPYFGENKTFGFMKAKRVNDFLKWLVTCNLENEIILKQQLFTNYLL